MENTRKYNPKLVFLVNLAGRKYQIVYAYSNIEVSIIDRSISFTSSASASSEPNTTFLEVASHQPGDTLDEETI